MEIHNSTEDIVFAKVAEVFAAIEKEGLPAKFCTCSQCQLDTACYVLNRVEPQYIISHRGVARAEGEANKRQQKEADIAGLIYEGLRRINHNQRPNFDHDRSTGQDKVVTEKTPIFNIPTIVGRLFNGANFAPLSDIQVALRWNSCLMLMKNGNWQNPYTIIEKVQGTYTFWPIPIPAEKVDTQKIFEFSIHVEAPDFEPLNHHFQIPVTSELGSTDSYSIDRTFKLPDLYMFPPGDEED
ncbi:hypothetical protein AGMMS49928_16290 [Spirochaetia bacterium]|nr:hypothetical protein AGMMS49928_16290 [Spirochaetia bacterium]